MNLKEEHEQKRYFIENMSEQDLTLAYERLANNGFPTKEFHPSRLQLLITIN